MNVTGLFEWVLMLQKINHSVYVVKDIRDYCQMSETQFFNFLHCLYWLVATWFEGYNKYAYQKLCFVVLDIG